MANRECNGTFYRLPDGTEHYRCLWDGAVMAAQLTNGDRCPHCARVIDGSDAGECVSTTVAYVHLFSDGSTLEIIPDRR